jgi:hypothetical protein
MDDVKDPLSDAALERDLEALLAVDPSPAFLARVRTRVAEEPVLGSRRVWGQLTAAVAAMAFIVFGLVVWRPSERGVVSVNAPVAGAPAPPSRSPGPAVTAVDRKPAVVSRREPAPVPAPKPPIEVVLPEIVVAENESRAFAGLMASIRQTRFELSLPVAPALEGPVTVDEIPAWAPVKLDPIEIKPIVEGVTLE